MLQVLGWFESRIIEKVTLRVFATSDFFGVARITWRVRSMTSSTKVGVSGAAMLVNGAWLRMYIFQMLDPLFGQVSPM